MIVVLLQLSSGVQSLFLSWPPRSGSHVPLISFHITAPIPTSQLKASQTGCPPVPPSCRAQLTSKAFLSACYSLCLHTSPKIPSLHSDLCTEFLPFSLPGPEIFSGHSLKNSPSSPSFCLSPMALITTENYYLVIYFVHKIILVRTHHVCM